MGKKLDWKTLQKTLIDYFKIDESLIQKKTNIYNDIGLDSLGILGMGMKLQAEFNITIPLAEVSSIKTLEDVLIKLNQFAE